MSNASARCTAALRAVQSGVMMNQQLDRNDGRDQATLDKHLRTGIDSAKAEHMGLAKLLISKGIITLEEHAEAMADALEEEKARYEEHLTQRIGTGTKVMLA